MKRANGIVRLRNSIHRTKTPEPGCPKWNTVRTVIARMGRLTHSADLPFQCTISDVATVESCIAACSWRPRSPTAVLLAS